MKIVKLNNSYILKIKDLFVNDRLIQVAKKYNYFDSHLNASYETYCQTYLSNSSNFYAFGAIKKNKLVSVISFYHSLDEASWYLTHIRSLDSTTLKPLMSKIIEFNESAGRYKFFSLIPAKHKNLYRKLCFDESTRERYDYFDEFYVPVRNKCNYNLPWQILFNRSLIPIETVVRCTFLKNQYRSILVNGGKYMKLNLKYMSLIVIPVLLLGVASIINMIVQKDFLYLLYTLFFWILLSGVGIAVGFHRIYSHRCFTLNKYFDRILLTCGTLACQSSSITWTSIHVGYHHRYTDTEKDPHTPTKGIFYSFLKWTMYINKDNINHKYAVNLIKDKWHLFFHKNYFILVWLFIIILGIINLKVLFYGYFIAAMLSILQDNLVNVFGHLPKLGYRNFDTNDNSSNFPLLGYLGWGQGWHNNHHKDPKSFDFGKSISGKWWEIDPCVIFLPLLKMFNKK